MYTCKICNRSFEKASQIGGHVSYCRAKKEGRDLKSGERFGDSRSWSKGLTKQSHPSIKLSAENLSNYLKQRHAKNGLNDPLILWHKDPIKRARAAEKVSESLKNGYATGKIVSAIGSGRGKSGWYKGIWCDSSWELAWVIYNFDHGILFKRNEQRFIYNYNNELHSYTPDFELADGTLIEIKGYIKDITRIKLSAVNRKIILLTTHEMKPILDYVKQKHGKNFISMYEDYSVKLKEKLNEIEKSNLRDRDLVIFLSKEWQLKESKVYKLILQLKPEFVSNYCSKKFLKRQELKKIKLLKKQNKIQLKQQIECKKNEDLKLLINKIVQANIDYSSFGWVGKVALIINKYPQKVNKWMIKNMPDFYKTSCFKRKT